MNRLRNDNKNNEHARHYKIKESLPYLENDDIPVFPKVYVKPSHTIRNIIIWIIILMSLLVFNSLYKISRVDGVSMDPTLKDGQFMLLSKNDSVDRFDIVVFNERIADEGDNKKIVKRVIGLPGDVVTVIAGNLYINSQRYDETYLDEAHLVNWNKVDWTVTVPEDHYFVLGDNRDNSKDSRTVGSFIKSSVDGVKVLGGKD